LRILTRKGAEAKSLLASLHKTIKVGKNEAPILHKLSYEPRERFDVSAEHSKILAVITKAEGRGKPPSSWWRT